MIPLKLYKPLAYLSILIVVLATMWYLISQVKHWKAEAQRQQGNVHALVQAPGETTRELNVKRGEFKEMFPAEYKALDSLTKRVRRVTGFQQIRYVYNVDTVLVPVVDTISIENPSLFAGNIWQFEANCLSAELSKPDSSDMLRMKLSGEIPINIITDLHRPKRWFIKFQWFKFHDSTKVTTPCGLTIKENVKFNFK